MSIPMVDLKKQYKSIKKEINNAVLNVIESTRFIMGPEVTSFEEEMALYSSTKYAIACGSGTDALMMSLMAAGLETGDEVITTPFTFAATAEVIRLLGLKAVFVDIKPDTYNIDPELVEKAVTKNTKAIIPVHLYGQIADMDEINRIAEKNNLIVIEDACQAVGAHYKNRRACSLGHMGALSFFPSKNLGAYGDGGMVLTSDEEFAKTLRMIRDHGSDRRYHHAILGLNSRLDAMQAAILRVKLKHLDEWNEARKDVAALYTELLDHPDIITPVINEDRDHIFHQYSIQVPDRDGLRDYLASKDIACAIHYPVPLHLQPAFAEEGKGKGSYPVAEKVADHVISLPMFPELEEKDIKEVAGAVLDYVSGSSK